MAKQKNKNKVAVTALVSSTVRAELKKAAAAENRSLANYVGLIITEHAERQKGLDHGNRQENQ